MTITKTKGVMKRFDNKNPRPEPFFEVFSKTAIDAEDGGGSGEIPAEVGGIFRGEETGSNDFRVEE